MLHMSKSSKPSILHQGQNIMCLQIQLDSVDKNENCQMKHAALAIHVASLGW